MIPPVSATSKKTSAACPLQQAGSNDILQNGKRKPFSSWGRRKHFGGSKATCWCLHKGISQILTAYSGLWALSPSPDPCSQGQGRIHGQRGPGGGHRSDALGEQAPQKAFPSKGSLGCQVGTRAPHALCDWKAGAPGHQPGHQSPEPIGPSCSRRRTSGRRRTLFPPHGGQTGQ